MRNIFDQYSQPENRITHAFLTALDQDRVLLSEFIREFTSLRPPRNVRHLRILEQQYPGELQPVDDEKIRRGIPDGWIFDEEASWCIIIESKVLAQLTSGQIQRHRATAKRLGFQEVFVVAITQHKNFSVPPDTQLREWSEIYVWLHGNAPSSYWAKCVSEFLEITEAKLIETERLLEGMLTTFSGFRFGYERPFSYLEGKRVLRLAMQQLKKRRDLQKGLGVNPTLSGRTAITGTQGDLVWDFLPLSKASGVKVFTNHPHLTLSLNSRCVEATVTVPNAVNGTTRKNIKGLGEEGFERLITEILKKLAPLLNSDEGAKPMFRGIQRRYPSQRSAAYIDALIEFDLRTAVSLGGPQKVQQRWLNAAYSSFVNKRGSNYQIQVGMQFQYDRYPDIREAKAIDLIAKAWLACEPLVRLSE